tara:strand:- start:218 stop:556 length:339 start_codon:yes stop_codon:yes gene_type:complete
MRITENRLRRIIRQVIKESLDERHLDLKTNIMNLASDLTPYSFEEEGLLKDRCLDVDADRGLRSGDLYSAIEKACEAVSAGSSGADGGTIACLQSRDAGRIIDNALRSLGLY